MDEITLFADIRPEPPSDLGRTSDAARRRLTETITAAAGQPAQRANPRLAGGSSRRRLGLAAAAVAATAAAAIVVPATLPGSVGGSFTGKAWAVERQQDGSVKLSMSQMFNDPAGLQKALRADGIPAVVEVHSVPVVNGQAAWKFSCVYQDTDTAPPAVQRAAVTFHPPRELGKYAIGQPAPSSDDATWDIRPSAIPSGSTLFIGSYVTQDQGAPAPLAGIGPTVLTGEQAPACIPN